MKPFLNYEGLKTMKNMLCLGLISLLVVGACQANSRSFFTPRSITTDSVFELALANYDRYHQQGDDCQESCVSFYWKPFFTKSNNGSCLARYFLPGNKACVSLDESGAGDIDPLWFSLISERGTFYTSTVCMCPTRKAFGAVLQGYINFDDCWWLGVTLTPMKAKHNLHTQEFDQTQEGTIPGFANACEAFNNPILTSGKIPCSEQCQAGVDDIQIKLGYDYYTCNDNRATIYGVGTIPTGRAIQSCVLFEPVVGTRHWSLGLGVDGDYSLWTCDNHTVALMGDLKYRYAFEGSERRSFDLTENGDWSRYLLVVTPQAPFLSIPAINLFTFPVDVTPRSTIDLWLAAHYVYCDDWHLEVGYDFWWRQAEKICLKNNCCATGIPSGYGIQTLDICPLTGTTASTANISQSVFGPNGVVSDPSFVQLQTSDLNVCSAAHPVAHSNTIYGAVAYDADICGCSMVLGINASYEFAVKNAFRQWAVWFTQGFDF